MIEKIDAREIQDKSKEKVEGYTNVYKSIKPTPYETACIDKVNEIVDRLNWGDPNHEKPHLGLTDQEKKDLLFGNWERENVEKDKIVAKVAKDAE